MENIRLLELFGGIGACTKAFERLGIPHEVVDYVEIDKYAVNSYNAIHGTNFEPQDITEWDKDIDVDFIMHGSPCQDFSLAGKQAGGDEGSGTRSSLMYESIRIIAKLKPKYVLWENVKNVISKKHIHNFNKYISQMNELGYKSYYKVLNSKNYGIPQNRDRVFTVSIRNDLNQVYEFPDPVELKLKLKDLLESKVDEKYYLSQKMLDYCVMKSTELKESGNGHKFTIKDGNEEAFSITTKEGSRIDNNFIATEAFDNTMWKSINQKAKINPSVAYPLAVRSAGGGQRAGVSNFVSDDRVEVSCKDVAMSSSKSTGKKYNYGSSRLNSTLEKCDVKDGDFIDAYNGIIHEDTSGTILTRVDASNHYFVATNVNQDEVVRKYGVFDSDGQKHQAGSVYDSEGLSPTLDTGQGGWRQPCVEVNNKTNDFIPIKNATKKGYLLAEQGDGVDISSRMETHRGTVQKEMTQTLDTHCTVGVVVDAKPKLRIRKLTPKECFRLMGFDDMDADKATEVNSNAQLYKQAGNSIVVNVLEAILKELIIKPKQDVDSSLYTVDTNNDGQVMFDFNNL